LVPFEALASGDMDAMLPAYFADGLFSLVDTLALLL
jgi:hypothetical protein